MKTIAVPVAAGRFSSHFGGAEQFALYTVDEETGTPPPPRLQATPPHERGVFPAWIRQLGADVVLTGGIGVRAVHMLSQLGVQVVTGVQGEDPDELVRRFLAGGIVSSGETCTEHGFHDCSHHRGGATS